MKKIMRYFFLLIGLLMATVVKAYKIEKINHSHGNITEIKYGTTDVTVGVDSGTEIPSGQTVTMTVTPDAGYYLSSLVYEEVTPLNIALAPRRAPGIKPIHNITIPTNSSTYLAAHFGGSYSFDMPENNVIITATFVACTSIDGGKVYWDSWDGTSALPQSKVYDGTAHTMKVRVGDTELTKDRHYTTTAYTLTNVDNITPTITGIGEYNGSISGTTTLSITQQPLTITANSQTISYGSSIETGLSRVTTIGLVTGDALTSITLTPSTSQVTTTGTITPSGATTTKGISNYAVTYNTGALTIQAYDLSAVALSDDVLDIDLDKYYFNYDGSLHKAQVTSIKYQNTPLASGTSYTYDYAKLGVYTGSIGTGNEANPENPVDYKTSDIYTIVITFCGNYTGTKTVEYQIRPKITMSGNNVWYTYYNPTYNMKMPDGVKAYTISDNTETQIILSPNNESGHGYIKAATPMLLYYTGASTDIYPELVKTDDSHLSTISSYTHYHGLSDATVVTSLPEYNTKDIWILVNNQFVRTDNGSIPANRCYLALVKNSITVPHFAPAINFGGLTGIDEPRDKKENVEMKIYNLNGQRVQNPAKGLYIVNGKKVIIK